VTAYRAAIFDLDGLLVDSETLWHRAELELLVPLGAEIDASSTRTTKGMFVGEVVDHYHELVGWTHPPRDELIDLLLDRVGELVEDEGRLMPGALRALQLCAKFGRRALASSTPRSLIDRVLARFGLTGAFEVVHSAEAEPLGKPHPAVYLTTAARLGLEPSACLAFEDSPAGVLAATSAGMGCVAVPAPEERGDPAFERATVVLASLDELDEQWLDQRFDRSRPRSQSG
jgi:HAD superfamily hydrolase (TIGR01509 family)